jgi:hypothetical protein
VNAGTSGGTLHGSGLSLSDVDDAHRLALLDALAAAKRLATEDDAFWAERSDLQAIGARLVLPSRRLVVVGETSRGKTTLVNALLGEDVVPAGPTETPVVVTTADVPKDGPWPHRSVAGPLFGGLVSEVVDTPAPSRDEDVDEVLRPLVVTSSVVVLAVSATSPFGIGERELVHRVMADRMGDHLVVAVTMLDLVDDEERPRVLASVEKKVRKIAPQAQVRPARDVDALRAHLAATLAAGDRDQRRWDGQTRSMLLDVVSRIHSQAERRSAEEERDHALVASVAADGARAVRQADLAWETVEVHLQARRSDLVRRLGPTLAAGRDKTTQQLEADLRSATDPQAWWRDDLQQQLWRELDAAARLVERRMNDLVATDLDWLCEQVEALTGTTPLVFKPETIGLDLARVHAPSPGMPNIALLRSGTIAATAVLVTTRVAMSGALSAIVPAAALGGAAYAVGTAVTRGGMKRAVDVGATALTPLVRANFETLERQVETAGSVVYGHIEDRLDELRDAWRAARPQTDLPRPPGRWSAIRETASALRSQLRSEPPVDAPDGPDHADDPGK